MHPGQEFDGGRKAHRCCYGAVPTGWHISPYSQPNASHLCSAGISPPKTCLPPPSAKSKAGVDVDLFKVYSSRNASTLRARVLWTEH